MLGVLYDDVDEDDKTISQMLKVIAIDPEHSNALNYIGYLLAEKGIRLDDAEEYVKKALSIEPESGHIIDSLGWVYYKKGDYERAIAELEKAIRYLPDDPIVVEHLGDAYLGKDFKKKAMDAYERAFELNPENTDLEDKLNSLREELNLQ
jgi:tetratricopeptide (TPR) repeat protein